MKKNGFFLHFGKQLPSIKTLYIFFIFLVLFNLILIGLLAQNIEKKRFMRELEGYVEASSQEFGVPKAVIFAVMRAESDFNQYARSSADARGLMQITAVALTDINRMLSESYTMTQMYDPEINIRCGTAYLSLLYQKYKIYATAFTAYNAGQGNVDTWLGDSRYSNDRKQLYHVPFDETLNYVKKVNQYYSEYQKQYGEN